MTIFHKTIRTIVSLSLIVMCVVLGSLDASAKDATSTSDAATTSLDKEKYPVFDPEAPRPAPIDAPTPEKLNESIRHGIDFLIQDQNPNGSWGSATQTKGLNIYAPIPGAHYAFRAACTALCVSAMIESGDTRPEVIHAIERGETWLMANLSHVRQSSADCTYNTWTYPYAIQALVRMYPRVDDAKRQERIRDLIKQQVEMLDRYECLNGGWNYYNQDHPITQHPNGSAMSFVAATGLVALAEARDLGIDPPEKMIETTMESIRRQRYPDFCYAYGEYIKHLPMRGINRVPGSAGRSQACNIAMYLWHDEKTTLPVIRTWLARLYAMDGWLSIARKKPIPHESFAQISGYFYYYGYYYGALCIDQLKPEERDYYRNHMAAILMPLQEKDGSWWDYPFYDYHQQYGTAMAVMSLLRCRVDGV